MLTPFPQRFFPSRFTHSCSDWTARALPDKRLVQKNYSTLGRRSEVGCSRTPLSNPLIPLSGKVIYDSADIKNLSSHVMAPPLENHCTVPWYSWLLKQIETAFLCSGLMSERLCFVPDGPVLWVTSKSESNKCRSYLVSSTLGGSGGSFAFIKTICGSTGSWCCCWKHLMPPLLSRWFRATWTHQANLTRALDQTWPDSVVESAKDSSSSKNISSQR